MKAVWWRTVLFSLCAFTAFIAVAEIFSVAGLGGAAPWSGHWGADRDPIPFGLQVVDIDPGGPAGRAGLRAGDLIDLRSNTLWAYGPSCRSRSSSFPRRSSF
jgi:hypothetical protein